MEMYFGQEIEQSDISRITGLSPLAISAIISMYSKAEPIETVLKSKVGLNSRDWYVYENWQTLPIEQIAEVLAISQVTVKKIAAKFNFPKKNRIVTRRVVHAYRCRVTIINLETGIFYLSEQEAAATIGMNYNTFKGKMNGYKKNNTSFKRV